MTDYHAINKKAWDKRVAIHVESKFYDVNGFLQGNSSLTEIETVELGNVSHKSLLHLQCHFGLDSLSLARMGAKVTAVDLSSAAIDKANELHDKINSGNNIDASFVCAEINEYLAVNDQQFDLVYTSFGAICWLPDLSIWAQGIARSLKQGGTFYMVEFHPILDLLSGYNYFNTGQADLETEGTYTENCDGVEMDTATWAHPISEVVNALIQAGLSIQHLNEFPYSPYNCFEGLTETENNRFTLIENGHAKPLVYSIKATKS
jgi:SAM-dependent methyltransferase